MHPCDNFESLLRTLQPPRRNNYFYGKRMDVQHFQMEQDYGKHKQWLLNRLTVGKGVVCGLKVSIDGNLVCVEPGFAIDGLGREIVVPVRACIDPVTQEGGCCTPCCGEAEPPPAPQPPNDGNNPPGANNPDNPNNANNPDNPPRVVVVAPPPQREARAATGYFTLWLCYHECRTDYQPVLVSDCGTREHCAPGTIVESFCLKVTPGVPPLQGDPAWCAKLWGKAAPNQPVGTPDEGMEGGPRTLGPVLTHGNPGHAAGADGGLPTAEEVKAAMESRRHLLCELFDGTCATPEGDSCVPLAVMLLRDNKVDRFESCLVRPRVYSNEILLQLILCLADKIDDCCNGHEPPPPPPVAGLMRVKSVEFLGGESGQDVIAVVQSPLDNTPVPIRRMGKAIRVVFTQPFDQGAHKPTTPGLNDADWKLHNFLVLPDGGPEFGLEYVPGSLTVEAPDTVRWELNPESPFYGRQFKGWQKGRRVLVIYGDADSAPGPHPMANTANAALDGEAIAPAGGAISGDGTAGGTFKLQFTIG